MQSLDSVLLCMQSTFSPSPPALGVMGPLVSLPAFMSLFIFQS